MATGNALNDLIDLSRIITDSLAVLKRTCEENNTPIPDINEPGFNPASEAFRADPKVDEACRLIAASGLQLAMSLLPPFEALYLIGAGALKAAGLRVALEGNVSEILREAGPKGLSASEIGEKAGVDGMIMGRTLRMLATNHIYREIKPDVFTNNRVSSMMDTMKPIEDIIARPAEKNDGTLGLAALLGHHLDEVTKSSAYLWECVSDPNIDRERSGKDAPSALQYAFNEKVDYWPWLEKPENAHRLKRFGTAMQAAAVVQPSGTVLKAFDWGSLPGGSVVVDVGGGVGTSTLLLADNFKDLKFIIQDRPPVVEDGKKVWSVKNPEAIADGRVEFMIHDFFTEQPVHKPSVFLLKHILHDWSDVFCLDILKHLRKAAGPDTKLVIIDYIIPYACAIPAEEADAYLDTKQLSIPSPLLANGGAAICSMPQYGDMIMLSCFNAQERTLHHIQNILKQSGWALNAVRRDGFSNFLQPTESSVL